MPKDEWGVKRVCPSCEGRFYDLQKEEMLCPYCGNAFTLESLMSDKPVLDKASDKAEDTKQDDVSDADVVLDDDDDSDLEVDDTLLEEDDDDNVSLEEIADVAADGDDDS